MEQSEKDILFKEICSRIPYGLKVQWNSDIWTVLGAYIDAGGYYRIYTDCEIPDKHNNYPIEVIKPFLRDMHDMTEEELIDYTHYRFTHDAYLNRVFEIDHVDVTKAGQAMPYVKHKLAPDRSVELYLGFTSYSSPIGDYEYGRDWLKAHHFDFDNLIGRKLAIKVTDENNPYEV